jgi:hypothetical protein
MAEATDIKLLLHLEKGVQLRDGSVRDAVNGYLTYKDSPIFKVTGWRNDDKKGVSSRTGKPYHIMSYGLSIFEGEDVKDADFKRPERITLNLAERERRKDGAPFFTLKVDQVYNVETKEPKKGFPIPGTDMNVCLQGIIPDRTIEYNDKTVHAVELTVNEYALSTMAKDFAKPVDSRVGYTMSSPDALMSDDMLESLKEQFKYFEGFAKTFERETADAGGEY